MCDYCGSHEHRIPEHTQDHSNTGDSAPVASNGKPIATVDQMAQYLTHGYWADTGRSARSFDITSGGEITVNLSGLTALGQETARTALKSWTAVSGIQFNEVTSRAQITFDDNFSGAFASTGVINGNVTSSFINVDDGWAKYGGYYLQTYIHEIGHALGLGHAGHYNGSGNYGRDANFANDSWQLSIMSYFSQSQNSEVDASFAYLVTPQLADILAVHNLYGVPTNVETGNTIYGDGNTTGIYGHDLSGKVAVALVDSGGIDLIDLSSHSTNDYLSLVEESFSDIGGKRGTFTIARGTVIENATTGSGDDKLTGNGADNTLNGGAGHDQILAGAGADVLIGGKGEDTLTGGAGADVFVYSNLNEAGDTIRDFNQAEGDRIDLIALLTKIGHLVADPFAAGVLQLKEAAGGAWLYVQDIKLAFLEGVSAAMDGLSLLVTDGLPAADPVSPPTKPTPPEEPVDDPVVDEEPTTAPDTTPDTTYVFDDSDVTGTTTLIQDTDGGIDTLDLSAVTYDASINLRYITKAQQVGEQTLEIHTDTEIENILFGAGDDLGIGNRSDNLMTGGLGSDTLVGSYGNDTLSGGDGNDLLKGGSDADLLEGDAGHDQLYGHNGDDTLRGGEGNDRLLGFSHDDLLDGGAGNDTLGGGRGDDTLTGGEGADVFVFKRADQIGDTITDFDHSEGDQLHIDVLLKRLGTDLDSVLDADQLSLQEDGDGVWLSLEQSSTDGSGGVSSTLNIAYLEGVSDDQTLTEDWFF